MRKILVLGDANSLWTRRVIENVLIPCEMSITLVTSTNTAFEEYYRKNNVEVVTTVNTNRFLNKYKVVRKVVSIIIFMHYYLHFKRDITHVQFGFYSTLRMISVLPKKYKLVITYWGSDLLRIPKNKLLKTRNAVKKADFISVGSEALLERIESIYGSDILRKVRLIRMGISSIPTIEERVENRKEIKEKILGKYAERVSIMVGYNAGPNQQHINIIKSIDTLDEKVKNRIVLLVPLTYLRNNNDYLKLLKDEITRTDLKCIVFESFFNEIEMAELCISVDMFINAQTTDAISGTMLELLCAGAKVINGGWLKYSFLEQNSIEYDTFNEFSELPMIVNKYLDYDVALSTTNRATIKKEFSWTEIKKNWGQVYETLI